MLSKAIELDELNPIVDQHLHCAITEYCLPIYQGTVRLQKLALLWMLEEKVGKGKISRIRKSRKSSQIRKIGKGKK